MVIYKYEITDDPTFIHVKGFNRVLKVDKQNDRLYVWCEIIDGYIVSTELEVRAIPTGMQFDEFDVGRYDDTFVMDNGRVWHVYIKRRASWINT